MGIFFTPWQTLPPGTEFRRIFHRGNARPVLGIAAGTWDGSQYTPPVGWSLAEEGPESRALWTSYVGLSTSPNAISNTPPQRVTAGIVPGWQVMGRGIFAPRTLVPESIDQTVIGDDAVLTRHLLAGCIELGKLEATVLKADNFKAGVIAVKVRMTAPDIVAGHPVDPRKYVRLYRGTLGIGDRGVILGPLLNDVDGARDYALLAKHVSGASYDYPHWDPGPSIRTLTDGNAILAVGEGAYLPGTASNIPVANTPGMIFKSGSLEWLWAGKLLARKGTSTGLSTVGKTVLSGTPPLRKEWLSVGNLLFQHTHKDDTATIYSGSLTPLADSTFVRNMQSLGPEIPLDTLGEEEETDRESTRYTGGNFISRTDCVGNNITTDNRTRIFKVTYVESQSVDEAYSLKSSTLQANSFGSGIVILEQNAYRKTVRTTTRSTRYHYQQNTRLSRQVYACEQPGVSAYVFIWFYSAAYVDQTHNVSYAETPSTVNYGSLSFFTSPNFSTTTPVRNGFRFRDQIAAVCPFQIGNQERLCTVVQPEVGTSHAIRLSAAGVTAATISAGSYASDLRGVAVVPVSRRVLAIMEVSGQLVMAFDNADIYAYALGTGTTLVNGRKLGNLGLDTTKGEYVSSLFRYGENYYAHIKKGAAFPQADRILELSFTGSAITWSAATIDNRRADTLWETVDQYEGIIVQAQAGATYPDGFAGSDLAILNHKADRSQELFLYGPGDTDPAVNSARTYARTAAGFHQGAPVALATLYKALGYPTVPGKYRIKVNSDSSIEWEKFS